jgi:hypothetical protein
VVRFLVWAISAIGSITRVRARLKFGGCAMSALWPTRADDPKHQRTYSSGFGLRLRGSVPGSALVWAGPFSLNGGRFSFCTLPVSYCVSTVTN